MACLWWQALFADDVVPLIQHDGITLRHQLTHQRIYARVFRIRLHHTLKKKLVQKYMYVNGETFDSLPKSRLIEGFLEQFRP